MSTSDPEQLAKRLLRGQTIRPGNAAACQLTIWKRLGYSLVIAVLLCGLVPPTVVAFDLSPATEEFSNVSSSSVVSGDPMNSLYSAVGIATESSTSNPILAQTIQTSPGEISSTDRVELLTKQILQKQIELQSLNTRFRMETALTSRWRQRRVFLYGETNANCTEVSLIESISARRQLLRSRRAARGNPNPNDPVETDDEPDNTANFTNTGTTNGSASNKSGSSSSTSGSAGATASSRPPRQGGRVHGRLAAANELQLTGQSVVAAGDLFELGLNFENYLQIRKRGFTPARYRQRVHPIALQLDSLIDQRDKAVAEQPGATPELIALQTQEGKMLSDLRDLSMIDYMEYHAATERFWVLQNTAFLLDFTRNAVGVSGNVISLRGSNIRNPRYAGASGVCSAITGVLVMLQPVVGRVSGNISGVAARRLVSKELTHINARSSDVFAADRGKLASTVQHLENSGQAAAGVVARLPVYAEQQKLMDDMNTFFTNERRRARGTLVENITFASLVGPPRVTNGVTGIIGGWRYFNDVDAKERLYLAGNTTYAAGTGINILETARVQASEELRQHRLGKAHMRTRERFKNRLLQLDKLQASIK